MQPDKALQGQMLQWCELWDCAELSVRVTLRTEGRLRSSIARTSVSKLEIRLHPDLADAPDEFVAEVVCHELAHLACHELHGPDHKPHGPEWQRLVELAGFTPATRARVPGDQQTNERSPRLLYVHTCPVCHFSHTARRAMRNWRCPECIEAGLSGELQIQSVPAQSA